MMAPSILLTCRAVVVLWRCRTRRPAIQDLVDLVESSNDSCRAPLVSRQSRSPYAIDDVVAAVRIACRLISWSLDQPCLARSYFLATCWRPRYGPAEVNVGVRGRYGEEANGHVWISSGGQPVLDADTKASAEFDTLLFQHEHLRYWTRIAAGARGEAPAARERAVLRVRRRIERASATSSRQKQVNAIGRTQEGDRCT